MYKTFICYRSKNNRPQYAPSEDVAGLLYCWIQNDEKFSALTPVLFEERCNGGVQFGKNGIEEFMPDVETFIVVICPDFFDEVLREYDTICIANEESDLKSKLKALDKVMSAQEHKKIYYWELKQALTGKGAAKRKFYPIFVSTNGQRWNSKGLPKLQEIFGDRILGLLERANTPALQYDAIQEQLGNFAWEELDEEESKRKVQELESNKVVTKFKNKIIRVLHTQESQPCQAKRISYEQAQKYLKRCTQTIEAKRKPCIPAGEKSPFSATNPAIIYDPLRTLYENGSEFPYPRLGSSLINAFNENADKLKLTKEFTYWDVNLRDSKGSYQRSISVCAVCFGTMITNHRLKKDIELGLITESNPKLIRSLKRTINSGLSLLVALRNPYKHVWPSQWTFDSKMIGIVGTINQTTISLSTFLSCDFLNPDGLEVKTLIDRHDFIWQTLNKLLSDASESILYSGKKYAAWGYLYDNNDFHTLLPTVFVFDTLVKMRQTEATLLKHFSKGNLTGTSIDSDFLLNIFRGQNRLDIYIDEILNYFEDVQNTVTGAFMKNESDSITHTAYVIKSLYIYREQRHSEEDPITKTQSMLEKATKYLLTRLEEMKKNNTLSIQPFERFERFFDENYKEDNEEFRKKAENYEHCAELIAAEALIKIAWHSEKYGKQAFALLDWLLSTYTTSGVIIDNGPVDFMIKGENSELPFPIYYAYYFRMVMSDYLRLLQKRDAEQKEETEAEKGYAL